MAGIRYSTTDGQLTIGGVAMKCPGWAILDLRPLWMPAAVRGQDRVIPLIPGVRPYQRRRTVTTHSLAMVITGLADRLGVAPQAGMQLPTNIFFRQLQANIDYLRTNVVDPTNTGNGTRAAVLTMPNGGTRSASVHVLGMTITSSVTHSVVVNLDLSIPSGVFT